MIEVVCELCGNTTSTADKLIAMIPMKWINYSNIRERLFRCEHCDEPTIEACPF
jgi:hypothetical protein